MKFNYSLPLVLMMLCLSGVTTAEKAIEDKGVAISRAELEYLVESWTPEMKIAAANNLGDRLELLNMALANKKIAEMAPSFSPEVDPEAYWRHIFLLRNMNRQFVVERHMAALSIPDMSELAIERYQSAKEKYAFVPELRSTSHILFLCPPGSCDRAVLRPEAEKVLEELNAGANFEGLAAAYSQDPGSKDKGGKFDKWIKLGEANVSPQYTGGAFSIESVGGYSGIVESQYGFHVIRLDGLKEEHYKPFKEVKEQIIAVLEQEYRTLSAKEFDAGFRITDDAFIDGAAMEEIFEQYKTVDPQE